MSHPIHNEPIENNVILVDMDGVFCDFISGYYDLFKAKHPELYDQLPDKDTLNTFYIDDSVDDPKLKQIIEDIVDDTTLFYDLPEIPGAIAGMKLLDEKAKMQGFKVMICTAPHPGNIQSYDAKVKWIVAKLGFEWLDRLMMVRDKSMVDGLILLDDKPDPLGRYNPTWKHVLFSQPCNRMVKGKPRINDWSERSIDLLLKLAQQAYLSRTTEEDFALFDPPAGYRSFKSRG